MTTYIKGAKITERQWNYGSFLSVSFKLEDLKQYANEKGYINMTISPRKEVGQYWDTHNAILNEWKPEWQSQSTPKQQNNTEEEISIENIPF